MKKETKELLLSKLAEGNTAQWTWEQLLLDVIKMEGIDCKGREVEVSEYAGRAVRGYYPNRKNVWDAAFNENPKADIELDFILATLNFQKDFTIAARPARPKPEEKTAPEKKEGKSNVKAGAPVPPAPPAPPSPPAPPKPEMAKSK